MTKRARNFILHTSELRHCHVPTAAILLLTFAMDERHCFCFCVKGTKSDL